jgi:hypothetical protein
VPENIRWGEDEKPAEQGAQHVEDPAQGVGAAGQGGGIVGLQQAALRDAHVDEVIEPVVEHDLRVEDHDHVDAEEHLEHVLVEIEVDR